MTGRGDGHRR